LLLIVQVIHGDLTVMTNDPKFPAYPATVLW
jgi:penicillin V acylase-like amidase (Ntn superfamily)